MTFLLALVPLTACAGLIALFTLRDDSMDARFAARHRVPANGRTWRTYSTAMPAGYAPLDTERNYGAGVAVDPFVPASLHITPALFPPARSMRGRPPAAGGLAGQDGVPPGAVLTGPVRDTTPHPLPGRRRI